MKSSLVLYLFLKELPKISEGKTIVIRFAHTTSSLYCFLLSLKEFFRDHKQHDCSNKHQHCCTYCMENLKRKLISVEITYGENDSDSQYVQ